MDTPKAESGDMQGCAWIEQEKANVALIGDLVQKFMCGHDFAFSGWAGRAILDRVVAYKISGREP